MLALLRAVLPNGHYPLWLQFIGEKKLPEAQKANSNLNFKMLSCTSICGSRFRYISSVSFNPDVKACT